MKSLFKPVLPFYLLICAFTFVSSQSVADDYTLNMQDVEIRDFINTISKLVEKTIIIDEKVSGKISIESPKSLTDDELYEIFLIQLGLKGYTVIDNGSGILKVIPEQGAKLQGAEVGFGIPNNNSDEIITQVIEVNNVNSNQLASTLRPLIDSKIGIITAYATSNVILITDRAANVRRISKIIQEVDKSDSQRLTIVKLEHASAVELERTLNNLSQKQGTEQTRAPASISADKRTNSLIIRAELADWLKLKDIIDELDAEVVNASNSKVIYLKYSKAADILPVLKGVSHSIVESATGAATGQNLPSSPRDVTINAHEQTNSIILTGDPTMIENLEGIVANLDIRRAQIMVEAIIAEISASKARELGVQWIFGNGDRSAGSINFPNTGKGIVDLVGAMKDGGSALPGVSPEGFNLGIGKLVSDEFGFAAFLQALATDSDTNILSTPNLVTLDNEEATIHVGQEVPIITGSVTSADNSNPFQTIERKDVGVKLTIKPQINEGSAILLDIQQEVSSISGLQATDIITNKRVIETTVLVDDGAMLALGGLMTDNVQESDSKIPVLGDIPLVGRAFRSDQSKREKRNLMVFIRPKVLYDQATATAETQKKYHTFHSQQASNTKENLSLLPEEKRPALPDWDTGKIAPEWYQNQPLPNHIGENGKLYYIPPEDFF